MGDEMVDGEAVTRGAVPDAAFHLQLGAGTVDVPSGRIVALIGENGSGAHQVLRSVIDHIVNDEQRLSSRRRPRGAAEHAAAGGARGALDGPVRATGVRASGALLDEARVAVITRRSGISPAFDLTENVFLGDMVRRMLGPLPVGLDWPAMRSRTAVLLGRVGCDLAPTAPSRSLGELDRLRVELARTLQRDAGLLVIDEPTALLDGDGAEAVIRALAVLRDAGVAVLVLTQKPREALGYADTVVVARDGEPVAVHPRAEWEVSGASVVRGAILTELVDRESAREALAEVAPAARSERPDELLRVAGWSTHDALQPGRLVVDGADLVVHGSEIVGIAGLARSGGETLLLSVYGRSAGSDASGTVWMRGEQVDTSTVEKSIAAGLFFAATDTPKYRMRFLGGISVPVASGRMSGLARSGLVDVEEAPSGGVGGRILGAVRSVSREGDAGDRIRGLVQAFAASEREVLLLGEPLQGATRAERAALVADITRATGAGKGVVIVSDDLESLRRLCDRIVVMAEGRVTGTVPAGTPAIEIAPLLAPN